MAANKLAEQQERPVVYNPDISFGANNRLDLYLPGPGINIVSLLALTADPGTYMRHAVFTSKSTDPVNEFNARLAGGWGWGNDYTEVSARQLFFTLFYLGFIDKEIIEESAKVVYGNETAAALQLVEKLFRNAGSEILAHIQKPYTLDHVVETGRAKIAKIDTFLESFGK